MADEIVVTLEVDGKMAEDGYYYKRLELISQSETQIRQRMREKLWRIRRKSDEAEGFDVSLRPPELPKD